MRHFSKTSENNNRALFRFHGVAPEAVFARLPQLRGDRIAVIYRPALTAWKGDLLSKSQKGDSVYAGCFLRKRRIVLEQGMLRTPRVLERIFVHEVFHFVWPRLGKPVRDSFHMLIAREMKRGVGGELGWSGESIKTNLTEQDRVTQSRRWKDYLCESFCDTAGWYFGSARQYSELTLGRESRAERRRWVREHLLERTLSI